MNARDLEAWRGVLEPLDLELGRLLQELDPEGPFEVALAAAAASRALDDGHSCLDLAQIAALLQPEGGGPALPDPAAFRAALERSPLVAGPDVEAPRPLVLDAAGRLYLRRFHRHERQVATALHALRDGAAPLADAAVVADLLRRHLDPPEDGAIDWQAVAIIAGLRARLAVITGGPGTGKTTTVLWLLATLLELAGPKAQPVIRLAAPTGKAAARMAESIREGLDALKVPDFVRAALPRDAATLHRLLGARPGSSRFRHDAGNPLRLDVLVVDEASMIDLPLMARLLAALPEHARLILLGDRDQLDSVEAGNVLASICLAAGAGGVGKALARDVERVLGARPPSADPAPPFADHVVELQRNWRFDATSGVGELARLVRAGDADAAIAGLRAARFDGVVWTEDDAIALGRDPALVARCAAVMDAANAEDALKLATRESLLTALRAGPRGAAGINAALDAALRLRGGGQPFHRGRLILIRQNDYDNGLFNGDIGIIWPDATDRLAAWFPQAGETLRSVPLGVLPAHSSAWALTIHKSQGSEFDAVRIVLPRAPARVLGRELLYTAVTRAKKRVIIHASEAVLRHAITHSTRRTSGLADMLR